MHCHDRQIDVTPSTGIKNFARTPKKAPVSYAQEATNGDMLTTASATSITAFWISSATRAQMSHHLPADTNCLLNDRCNQCD
jgi:hypothetical protein